MNPSGRAKRAQQKQILDEVLGRAVRAGARGVVVFDLDSTLLDNRPRQAQILAEYGASIGHPVIAGIRPEHWRGWDVRRALRNAGLPEDEVKQHFDAARRFWRERFFTSRYCALDVHVPGAPEYVRELQKTGVQIAYVTGRHLEMGEGTVASFRSTGIPEPDGKQIHLMLKPTMDMHDDAWKRDAHARLDRVGEVIAAFDNEPAHVNGYAEAFPGATVVHLDTDHSERPIEVLARVPSILDFVR